MEFNTNIFEQYDKKWALLTVGDKDKFNTMTISWGGLGTLWNKPVATVYVRTSRYTNEFMKDNDYFTVSFYPEECKKTLGVLGSKSGRDMDKVHESGLTSKEVENGITFEEAEVTLVCRKLICQRLEPENMIPEIAKQFYENEAQHDMYVGEVVFIEKNAQ
ncbi:Flavin reductase like domain-containing protein [Pseudobutyrivibrio sp. C4]|uniref:flavin reductase n=1 Tax=Pseudobutyrivibrio sp. C4 TaxID=1520803 RepID=UPI0008CB05D6|nr:flavin reductase [Pseudobutyrivibrio sp. C4]SES66142.1 Flavin reductase like domain-containing protein [Pseudobutyrivibrio sp. C4]